MFHASLRRFGEPTRRGGGGLREEGPNGRHSKFGSVRHRLDLSLGSWMYDTSKFRLSHVDRQATG